MERAPTNPSKVKRKAVTKDHTIQIRVTDEQKKTLVDAANRSGIGVSPWVLRVALRAAAAGE